MLDDNPEINSQEQLVQLQNKTKIDEKKNKELDTFTRKFAKHAGSEYVGDIAEVSKTVSNATFKDERQALALQQVFLNVSHQLDNAMSQIRQADIAATRDYNRRRMEADIIAARGKNPLAVNRAMFNTLEHDRQLQTNQELAAIQDQKRALIYSNRLNTLAQQSKRLDDKEHSLQLEFAKSVANAQLDQYSENMDIARFNENSTTIDARTGFGEFVQDNILDNLVAKFSREEAMNLERRRMLNPIINKDDVYDTYDEINAGTKAGENSGSFLDSTVRFGRSAARDVVHSVISSLPEFAGDVFSGGHGRANLYAAQRALSQGKNTITDDDVDAQRWNSIAASILDAGGLGFGVGLAAKGISRGISRALGKQISKKGISFAKETGRQGLARTGLNNSVSSILGTIGIAGVEGATESLVTAIEESAKRGLSAPEALFDKLTGGDGYKWNRVVDTVYDKSDDIVKAGVQGATVGAIMSAIPLASKVGSGIAARRRLDRETSADDLQRFNNSSNRLSNPEFIQGVINQSERQHLGLDSYIPEQVYEDANVIATLMNRIIHNNGSDVNINDTQQAAALRTILTNKDLYKYVKDKSLDSISLGDNSDTVEKFINNLKSKEDLLPKDNDTIQQLVQKQQAIHKLQSYLNKGAFGVGTSKYRLARKLLGITTDENTDADVNTQSQASQQPSTIEGTDGIITTIKDSDGNITHKIDDSSIANIDKEYSDNVGATETISSAVLKDDKVTDSKYQSSIVNKAKTILFSEELKGLTTTEKLAKLQHTGKGIKEIISQTLTLAKKNKNEYTAADRARRQIYTEILKDFERSGNSDVVAQLVHDATPSTLNSRPNPNGLGSRPEPVQNNQTNEDKIDTTPYDLIKSFAGLKSNLVGLANISRKKTKLHSGRTSQYDVTASLLDTSTKQLNDLNTAIANSDVMSRNELSEFVKRQTDKLKAKERHFNVHKRLVEKVERIINKQPLDTLRSSLVNDTHIFYELDTTTGKVGIIQNPSKYTKDSNGNTLSTDAAVANLLRNNKDSNGDKIYGYVKLDRNSDGTFTTDSEGLNKALEVDTGIIKEINDSLADLRKEHSERLFNNRGTTDAIDKRMKDIPTATKFYKELKDDLTKTKKEHDLLKNKKNKTKEDLKRLVKLANKYDFHLFVYESFYKKMLDAVQNKDKELTGKEKHLRDMYLGFYKAEFLANVTNENVSSIKDGLTNYKLANEARETNKKEANSFKDLMNFIKSNVKSLIRSMRAFFKDFEKDLNNIDREILKGLMPEETFNMMITNMKEGKGFNQINKALKDTPLGQRIKAEGKKFDSKDEFFNSFIKDSYNNLTSAGNTDFVTTIVKANRRFGDTNKLIEDMKKTIGKTTFDKLVNKTLNKFDANKLAESTGYAYMDLFEEVTDSSGNVTEVRLQPIVKEAAFMAVIRTLDKLDNPTYSKKDKSDSYLSGSKAQQIANINKAIGLEFLSILDLEFNNKLYTESGKEARITALGKTIMQSFNIDKIKDIDGDVKNTIVEQEVSGPLSSVTTNKFEASRATDQTLKGFNLSQVHKTALLRQAMTPHRLTKAGIDFLTEIFSPETNIDVSVDILTRAIPTHDQTKAEKIALTPTLYKTLKRIAKERPDLSKAIAKKYDISTEYENGIVYKPEDTNNNSDHVIFDTYNSDLLNDELVQHLDAYNLASKLDFNQDKEFYVPFATQQNGRSSVDSSRENIQSNKVIRHFLAQDTAYKNEIGKINKEINKRDPDVKETTISKPYDEMKGTNGKLTRMQSLALLTALDLASPGRSKSVKERSELLNDKVKDVQLVYEAIKTFHTETDSVKKLEGIRKLKEEGKVKLPFSAIYNLISEGVVYNQDGTINLKAENIQIEIDGISFGFTTLSIRLGLTEAQASNAFMGGLSILSNNIAELETYQIDSYGKVPSDLIMLATDLVDRTNETTTQYNKKRVINVETYDVNELKQEILDNIDTIYKDKSNLLTKIALRSIVNSTFHSDIKRDKFKKKMYEIAGTPENKIDDTHEVEVSVKDMIKFLTTSNKKGRPIGKIMVMLAIYGSGVKVNAGKAFLHEFSQSFRDIYYSYTNGKDNFISGVENPLTLKESKYSYIGNLRTNDALLNDLLSVSDRVDAVDVIADKIENTPELQKALELDRPFVNNREGIISSLAEDLIVLRNVFNVKEIKDLKDLGKEENSQKIDEIITNLGNSTKNALANAFEEINGQSGEFYKMYTKVANTTSILLLKQAVKDAFPENHSQVWETIFKLGENGSYEIDATDTDLRSIVNSLNKIVSNKEYLAKINANGMMTSSALELFSNNLLVSLEQNLEDRSLVSDEAAIKTANNSSDSADTTRRLDITSESFNSRLLPLLGQIIDGSMVQHVMNRLPQGSTTLQIFDAFIGSLSDIGKVSNIVNETMYDLLLNPYANPMYTIIEIAQNNLEEINKDPGLSNVINIFKNDETSNVNINDVKETLDNMRLSLEISLANMKSRINPKGFSIVGSGLYTDEAYFSSEFVNNEVKDLSNATGKELFNKTYENLDKIKNLIGIKGIILEPKVLQKTISEISRYVDEITNILGNVDSTSELGKLRDSIKSLKDLKSQDMKSIDKLLSFNINQLNAISKLSEYLKKSNKPFVEYSMNESNFFRSISMDIRIPEIMGDIKMFKGMILHEKISLDRINTEGSVWSNPENIEDINPNDVLFKYNPHPLITRQAIENSYKEAINLIRSNKNILKKLPELDDINDSTQYVEFLVKALDEAKDITNPSQEITDLKDTIQKALFNFDTTYGMSKMLILGRFIEQTENDTLVNSIRSNPMFISSLKGFLENTDTNMSNNQIFDKFTRDYSHISEYILDISSLDISNSDVVNNSKLPKPEQNKTPEPKSSSSSNSSSNNSSSNDGSRPGMTTEEQAIEEIDNISIANATSVFNTLIDTFNGDTQYNQDPAWLKDRFEHFIKPFANGFNVRVVKDLSLDTHGYYNPSTNTVTVSLSDKTINRMSPAEIFSHEVVHALTSYLQDLAKTDPWAKAKIMEIEKLRDSMLNKLTKEDKVKLAKDMNISVEDLETNYLNYMKDPVNGINEFMAISQTNKHIHNMLEQVSARNDLKFRDKVFNVLKTILNRLFGTSIELKHKSEIKALDTLVQNVIRSKDRFVNASVSRSVLNNVYRVLGYQVEKVGTAISIPFNALTKVYTDKVSKYINDLHEKVTSGYTPSKLSVKTAVLLTRFMLAPKYKDIQKKTLDILRAKYGYGTQYESNVAQMYKEYKDKILINKYIGKTNEIDKARNHINSSIKESLKEIFKGTKITHDDELDMGYVLKGLDLSSIDIDLNNIDNVHFIEGKITSLINELTALLNQVSNKVVLKETMLSNVDTLAHYMATGEVNGFLISNARNIALGVKHNGRIDIDKIEYDVNKIENVLDKMISYKALLASDKTKLNKFKDLYKQYPEQMDTLYKQISDMNREAKARFESEPNRVSNYQKGYIARSLDKSIEVKLVNAREVEKYKTMGYKPIQNGIPTDNSMVLMVSKLGFNKGFVRGIIRMNNSNTRGWTIGSYVKSAYPNYTPEQLEEQTYALTKSISESLANETSKWGDYKFIPVFDANGDIKDLQLSMTHKNRTDLGLDNTGVFEAMANEHSSILDKDLSRQLNEEFIASSIEDYNANKNVEAYVFIDKAGIPSGNITSPKVREALKEIWLMMPIEMKQAIEKSPQGLPLRSEFVSTITGHNELRMTDKILDEDTKYKLARRGLYYVESLALKLAKKWKETVVIKNPRVIIGNLMSNVSMALMHGMSPRQIIQGLADEYETLLAYNEDMQKIYKIQSKMSTLPLDEITKRAKLEMAIQDIESKWSGTHIQKLRDAGLLSDIVEDISFENENVHEDMFDRAYKENIQRLPSVFQKGIDTALITQNTELWKYLNKGVQYSDTLFRLAMMKQKTKEGMSDVDAIDLVERTFINYTYAEGPFLKWMQDIGIYQFVKYFFGSQRAIQQDIFNGKVGQFAALKALEAGINTFMRFGLETPYNAFLPFKLSRALDQMHMPIVGIIDLFKKEGIPLSNFLPGIKF